MTLEDSILAQRLRVMRRAHELGRVSAACREAGISRTLFYRWRKRFERDGPDGLHPRRRQARRGRSPQIPPHVERLVGEQALAWPTWGRRRRSAHLGRDLGIGVAARAPSSASSGGLPGAGGATGWPGWNATVPGPAAC